MKPGCDGLGKKDIFVQPQFLIWQKNCSSVLCVCSPPPIPRYPSLLPSHLTTWWNKDEKKTHTHTTKNSRDPISNRLFVFLVRFPGGSQRETDVQKTIAASWQPARTPTSKNLSLPLSQQGPAGSQCAVGQWHQSLSSTLSSSSSSLSTSSCSSSSTGGDQERNINTMCSTS